MKNIYFYSNKEVITFCESLFRYESEINIQWKTDKNWGNQVHFIDENVSLDVLIKCVIHVFMGFRINDAIESVIKEDYYFSNPEEIDRIAELTNWILSEKGDGYRLGEKNVQIEDVLYDLFKSNLQSKKTVHYDSVIKFRMQPLKEYLIHIVGLAIDEFKREEEHQDFIHSIREYIHKRKPKVKEVHLLQGDPFLFYKANGSRFTSLELKSIMHKEPLYMIGLDATEMNLAPLIALLPGQIYIYGEYPSEAKTLTIINIFQERVRFYPYEKFPFKPTKDKS